MCNSILFSFSVRFVSRMITILGPTASGKTSLAVALAAYLHSEVISGDSRQVYRRMDLGTGKDLDDYIYKGIAIPYHLIDIAEPGTKYTVFDFQRDFLKVYNTLTSRGVVPIFCGGSGLYLESVLRSYQFSPVPVNHELRDSLSSKSLDELTEILSSYKKLHNTTDVDTAQRAIRAIEIADYNKHHPEALRSFPTIGGPILGVDIPREVRRERITRRLHTRIEQGMLVEIRRLLDDGVSAEDLMYYGLEYKYLTLYILGELSYTEMIRQLEIAIHQFAKRQMTWFRGMERRGIRIHWIDGTLPMNQKLQQILDIIGEKSVVV